MITISIISILNLSLGNSPTLYIFVLSYSSFIALGILIYILRNRGANISSGDNKELSISVRFNKILTLILLATLAMIIIILSESKYIKPTSYYLLVAIATGIIGLQIIVNRTVEKKSAMLILFEILFLAAIVRGSSILINPYLIGQDVPYHFHTIENIVASGHTVIASGPYYYYPAYHISQAASNLLIGSSPTTFDLINFGMSLSAIPAIFCVTKRIFNDNRAGLMAALILSVATLHIAISVYNSSKIGGFSLLLIGFLLIVKNFEKPRSAYIPAVWVMAVAVFFWHLEISFALTILLAGSAITSLLARKKNPLIYLFPLYLIINVFYIAVVDNTIFADILRGIFYQGSPILVQNFQGRILEFSFFAEALIGYIGLSAMALAGSYMILRWLTNLSRMKLMLISSLILMFLLPLTGILSSSFGLNPERTLAYSSLLLVIFMAGALVLPVGSKRKRSIALLITILMMFSFFSVTSYLIGDDNNILNDSIPRATTFATDSNLATHGFLNSIPKGSAIIGDYETLRYVTDSSRGFLGLQDRHLFYFPNTAENGYFVINTPNLDRLNWDDVNWGMGVIMSLESMDHLYDNGALGIYMSS